MRALAALRAPVDAFFVAVTVNAEDPGTCASIGCACCPGCARPCTKSRISRGFQAEDPSPRRWRSKPVIPANAGIQMTGDAVWGSGSPLARG